MVVKAIISLDEFRTLVNSGKPILIEFWATWCGPCRVIAPIFERLSNEAPAGIEFCKVDIDDHDNIREEAGIRAMPAFQLWKNGTNEVTVVGFIPENLESLVQKAKSLLQIVIL